MKRISQRECLNVFDETPFPRKGGELRFIQRFMFNLNDLSKSRGYRLFSWMEYAIRDSQVIGSWIVSNIEELSKEIIDRKLKSQKECEHKVRMAVTSNKDVRCFKCGKRMFAKSQKSEVKE